MDDFVCEEGPPRMKKLSFFIDANPECVYSTVFERKYAHLKGKTTIVESDDTTKEIIDREVEILMSSKKIYERKPLKNGRKCFTVNQLHNPQNIKQLCQMCGKGATLCCTRCMVTFYCCWDHQKLDPNHDQVCEMMKVIRCPIQQRFSSFDRRRQISKKLLLTERLLDDLIHQSYTYLSERQYEHAMGTFNQCFGYIENVFGRDHYAAQMIFTYMGMAECYVELNQMKGASNILFNASGVLFIEQDLYGDRNHVICKAHISRIHGLILLKSNMSSLALGYFSEYIYTMTAILGPTDIRLCSGYFLIAKAFLELDRDVDGYCMISFCVDLWLEFLTTLWRKKLPDAPKFSAMIFPIDMDENASMTRYLRVEFKYLFTAVWDYISEETKPALCVKIYMCLSIQLALDRKCKESRIHANKGLYLLKTTAKNQELRAICRYALKLTNPHRQSTRISLASLST